MHMNMENNKPVQRASIVADGAIYEMIYDAKRSKSSFVKWDGKDLTHDLKDVEHGGTTYTPYGPLHIFTSKNVVRFPSKVIYEHETKLVGEIRAFIHRYLDVSETFEVIASYYVLLTWQYDRFNEVPYLRAIGDFGSGKSRFLQTIGIICYKPISTGGATTTSPIFRILDEVGGTLILDEADFKYSDKTSDIIKILNTGYQKGTPVLRMDGKRAGGYDMKAFEVFGPKIIATREPFSDMAVESRCLTEHMGMSNLRKDIPHTLGEEFYATAEELRNKLLCWRMTSYFKPLAITQEGLDWVHPRLKQIALPLLSIIQDEDSKEILRSFITKHSEALTADRGSTWESEVVLSILTLRDKEAGAPSLTVQEITDEVNMTSGVSDENLSTRKVGYVLRSKLQFKTSRKRDGWTFSFKENAVRLEFWENRLGLKDKPASHQERAAGEANIAPTSLLNKEINNDIP